MENLRTRLAAAGTAARGADECAMAERAMAECARWVPAPTAHPNVCSRRVRGPAAHRLDQRSRGGLGRPPRGNGHGGAGGALWLLAALALAGCAGPAVEVVETREAMDTEVTVRVVAPTEKVGRQWLALAWAEMDECVARLDRHREGSDVWRLNKEAGRWHVEVHPLVTSCLAAAKEVYDLTGKVFDPTVGPLIELWRQAENRGREPTDEEIAKARALVGMDKLEMIVATVQKPLDELAPAPPRSPPPTPDELTRMMYSVGLREGMQVDLGGIAKGYVAGRMARRLQQTGAVAGLVAAAGDVYAFGRRPAGVAGEGRDRRWGVGVQDPRYPDDRSHLYTAIRICDQGVDTSGHYYRGFWIGDKRFSHILDPRTGRPVETRLASVTVVADDSATSDALATAIAVLGVREGLALVETLDGIECLLLETAPVPASVGGADETTGEAPLIAHRSSGFAAMEYDPGGAPPHD